ncbi:hypothetical protein FRC02_008559 [Tulasnella sp. 418]|nr:hypothetical protein FRC02_008559 [Tulasnella sp. 418]
MSQYRMPPTAGESSRSHSQTFYLTPLDYERRLDILEASSSLSPPFHDDRRKFTSRSPNPPHDLTNSMSKATSSGSSDLSEQRQSGILSPDTGVTSAATSNLDKRTSIAIDMATALASARRGSQPHTIRSMGRFSKRGSVLSPENMEFASVPNIDITPAVPEEMLPWWRRHWGCIITAVALLAVLAFCSVILILFFTTKKENGGYARRSLEYGSSKSSTLSSSKNPRRLASISQSRYWRSSRWQQER